MTYSVATSLNNRTGARKLSCGVLLTLGLLFYTAEHAVAQLPRQEAAATAAADWPLGVSLDRLSATRDRPVFSPSRRPPRIMETRSAPPPPPPPPPAAPPAPPSLTFFGTFESRDEVGANVQLGPNEKPTILRFGSYIDGWRVTEISRYRLVLSLGDRTVEFTLFSPKGPASQPTISQRPLASEPPLPGEPPPRLEMAGHDLNGGNGNHKRAR